MKLIAPFAFKGSTDEFTFYQSKHGNIIRRRTKAVDKKRIDTDPKFETTRHNYIEFSRAAKAAKLVRKAFRTLLVHAKNANTSNHFTGIMFKVIKSDVSNERGQRQVSQGNLSLLQHHEFNAEMRIANCINAPYTVSIDRDSGNIKMVFAEFAAKNVLKAPKAATHFRISIVAAEVDFNSMTQKHTEFNSTLMEINSQKQNEIVLLTTIAPGTKAAIIVALGLEFYESFGNITSLIKPSGLAIAAVSNI